MGGARIFDVEGSLAAVVVVVVVVVVLVLNAGLLTSMFSKSIPMNVQKVSENVGCDGF